MSDLERFSEAALTSQLNLGLGYECTSLCNRVLCFRPFVPPCDCETATVAEVNSQCTPDTSVSGYDHTVWVPKKRLKYSRLQFNFVISYDYCHGLSRSYLGG